MAAPRRNYTLQDLQRDRGYEAETARRQQILQQSSGGERATAKALLRYRENKQLNYERQKRGLAPVNYRGNVIGPAPVPEAQATVPLPTLTPAAAPTPPAAAAPVVPNPVTTNAPVAVTDPASQISPEEQAARLRARLLLSQGSNRLGRMLGLSSSQLGYRMLTGGGAA